MGLKTLMICRGRCDISVLTLTLFDEGDLSRLGSATVPEGVDLYWKSDDGRHLALVATTGIGKRRSIATVASVDLDTLEVSNATPVAHTPSLSATSQDGGVGYVIFNGRNPRRWTIAFLSSPPS
jgi:hypothetical protein